MYKTCFECPHSKELNPNRKRGRAVRILLSQKHAGIL